MVIDIYGKRDCSYCKAAIDFLDRKDIGYDYYLVENLKDEDYQSMLDRAPGAKTVPIVFIDGVWIGGYQELIRRITNEQA